tara:strand:+ start:145 stop:924 length:780 start_codon:yes stop_codon:yes gene_type:complete
MTTKNENLKTLITDNINDIASGVRKDSNARLNLVVLLQEVEKSGKFDFLIDLNAKDQSKESWVGDFKTIHQINKLTQAHLKYLRDTFMMNFLGVKWKASDKDNKAKLDALRDAMSAFVCVSVNAKNMNKDILKKKNDSYFTGANKSKVYVNGAFVNKECEPLNKDNVNEIALNFSELTRVARAWYKRIGGDGNGRKLPFDSAIERATRFIDDDLNAVKPFDLSSSKSHSLVNFLVNNCNKWLQAKKNIQTELKEKRKAS